MGFIWIWGMSLQGAQPAGSGLVKLRSADFRGGSFIRGQYRIKHRICGAVLWGRFATTRISQHWTLRVKTKTVILQQSVFYRGKNTEHWNFTHGLTICRCKRESNTFRDSWGASDCEWPTTRTLQWEAKVLSDSQPDKSPQVPISIKYNITWEWGQGEVLQSAELSPTATFPPPMDKTSTLIAKIQHTRLLQAPNISQTVLINFSSMQYEKTHYCWCCQLFDTSPRPLSVPLRNTLTSVKNSLTVRSLQVNVCGSNKRGGNSTPPMHTRGLILV